jgi:uncharacterized protein (DUF4415 family)
MAVKQETTETTAAKRGRKSDGKTTVRIRLNAEVLEKLNERRWTDRRESVEELIAEIVEANA